MALVVLALVAMALVVLALVTLLLEFNNALSQSSVGNRDIHSEQKILFMNEMKRNKIWPRLKG
jgi:hypothetical protein